jgi:hypothetical protein
MKTLVFIKAHWLTFINLAVVLFVVSCCRPEDDILVPMVKSVAVNDITGTSAVISGMISFDGGSKITERGIYFNDVKKIPADYVNGEPIFAVTVSNLTPGTTYTARAYATNVVGVSYGESLEFTTLDTIDTILTPEPLPDLEIWEVTEVSINSAVLRGLIKCDYALEGLVFLFEYGLDENFGNFIQAELWINNSEGVMAMAQIGGLEEGTTYFYRLRVINSVDESAYSPVSQFTTAITSISFSLSSVEMTGVTTDEVGDVYVMGVTYDNSSYDGVVAKFNTNGELLWKQMIVTENYDRPQGGLIAKDGILYVHVNRYDEYGTGSGQLYVDAYNCESGELVWSTEVSEGLGSDLALSADGFIYSVASIHITKLSLAGSITSRFIAQGAYSFSAISFYGNKVLIGGSRIIAEGLESMIWCFDTSLNLLWDNPGISVESIASATSIVSFPDKNLIFVGESKGSIVDGTPMEASVVCYEFKENSLEFKWGKLFDESFHIRLQREGDNFYVYSSDYGISGISDNPKGPILMNTQGDILWTASPKKNGYMFKPWNIIDS